jgi:hypothetical protein
VAEGSRVWVSVVSDADPAVGRIGEPGMAVAAIAGDGKGGMRDYFGRTISDDDLAWMLREASEPPIGGDVKIRVVVFEIERTLTLSDVALALNRISAAFRRGFPQGRNLHVFIPSDIFRPGWPGE